ncbi:MAG: tyrosine-type recombinase/integrase [Patescibacteria group bacterium]
MYLYKRGEFWWIGYYQDRKLIQKSLKTKSKEIAKIKKADLELKQARGELGIELQTIPVEDFYRQYWQYRELRKNPSTLLSDKYRLKKWFEFLKEKEIFVIQKINKNIIDEFISKKLSSGISPLTLNHYIDLIKNSLKWGMNSDFISLITFEKNKINKVEKLKVTKKPIEIFTKEEVKKLVQIAEPKMNSFISILFLTGMRAGELLALKWQDLNFKKGILTIPQTKSKKPRLIPLSDQLTKIFKKIDRNGDKIFQWQNVTTVSHKFTNIRKMAGYKRGSLHTLRKTFATSLLEAGISPKAIQELLGHSTANLTLEIYSSVTQKEKKKAMNVIKL